MAANFSFSFDVAGTAIGNVSFHNFKQDIISKL
jgi:hypothetical protein